MKISRPDIRSDQIIVPTTSWLHFGEQKIDIDKFASMLGYEELIAPQIAMINAYLDPQYRFITACLSRRTGKTIAANLIGNIVGLFPNTNILIICPDYSLANISWDLQQKYFGKLGIKMSKSNVRDREMVTDHGSMIKLASAEKADSAVGRSYDLIIFDEAALHEKGKDVFDVALRPTLDKMNSKCIFISTPRGDNYFKEFYDRGFSPEFPSWISLHSTWRDNPRAVEADILEARKGISEAKFAQEYEAKFTTFEGQAFAAFDSEKNVFTDFSEISDEDPYEHILGVDIGFRDPTACVAISLFKKDDVTHAAVMQAWEENRLSTNIIASKIQATLDEFNTECIYIDSAAAQTKYDLAELYDITCINADKAIINGVAFIEVLIREGRLLVQSECTDLILAIKNITWDAKSEREKLTHNKYIHLIDALRYALYTHRHEFM